MVLLEFARKDGGWGNRPMGAAEGSEAPPTCLNDLRLNESELRSTERD